MTKKPHAKDWKARDIEDWNAITFHSYLVDLHQERFNTPYIANNIQVQNVNIKRVYDEFGKAVLKEFIDTCFKTYKLSQKYKGINFMFCYNYLRDKYLHQAMENVKQRNKQDNYKDFYKNDAFLI